MQEADRFTNLYFYRETPRAKLALGVFCMHKRLSIMENNVKHLKLHSQHECYQNKSTPISNMHILLFNVI